MKTFSQFTAEQRLLEALEREQFILLFENEDTQAERLSEALIIEGKTYDLGKGYSARFDKAHVSNQKDHLHVLYKKNQLFVINKDGTPSHGTDISSIPNKLKSQINSLGIIDLLESTQNDALLILTEIRLYGPDNMFWKSAIKDIQLLLQ